MDLAFSIVAALFGLFILLTFLLLYTDRIADLVGRRKQD